MAGTVIADIVQAASTSQLNIKNGVALTPPTISDVNNVAIGTFCRAWINFNGTGTPAARASFNVTSITDNGTGSYTLNFTNAMPDVNYCVSGSAGATLATLILAPTSAATMLTTSVQVFVSNTSAPGDNPVVCVAIHR
jgi:hypothetical protein